MKKIILVMLVLAFAAQAQTRKRNIKYEYKKYEKFDFEKMDIGGDKSSPGDLSVTDRVQSKFKNKIPNKPNFVPEMKASLDAVL